MERRGWSEGDGAKGMERRGWSEGDGASVTGTMGQPAVGGHEASHLFSDG